MATQTSNLGLTKPAYSETADIADINNNMDKVDAAVHGVQNGMAILANGNVHSAVTSGQYVYVRNHGTLAEGLYTATTNISTNATLSTSNLTAVPNNGALNTLRDDVTSLNSNLAKKVKIISAQTTIPSGGTQAEFTVTLPSAEADVNYVPFVFGRGGNTSYLPIFTVASWTTTQITGVAYNCGGSTAVATRDVHVMLVR